MSTHPFRVLLYHESGILYNLKAKRMNKILFQRDKQPFFGKQVL